MRRRLLVAAVVTPCILEGIILFPVLIAIVALVALGAGLAALAIRAASPFPG